MSRSKPRPRKFLSWSFSRFSDYRQCPQRAAWRHLDKLPEPKSDAMERGAKVHDDAKLYIHGKTKKLPPEFGSFRELINMYRKLWSQRMALGAKGMAPVVENDWGFDKDWQQCSTTDWDRCVLRIKVDAGHWEDAETFIVTDWKTGRVYFGSRAEYVEQLELYALAVLLVYPHCKVVKPRLVYVDADEIFPEPGSKDEAEMTYTRSDLPMLKKRWTQRTKAMLSDTKFAARANEKCKWCHYSAAKNGPCKF